MDFSKLTDIEIVAVLEDCADRSIGGGCTTLSHGFVEVACGQCRGLGFRMAQIVSPIDVTSDYSQMTPMPEHVKVTCDLCGGKGYAIIDAA